MRIIVLVVITIEVLVAVVWLAPKVSQPTILKIMKQALNQQPLATHKIISSDSDGSSGSIKKEPFGGFGDKD